MKLKKKTVTTIIVLTTAALLGLICIQIYLLANALELKKQAFGQNVNAALATVVQKLETREAVTDVFKVSVEAEEEILENTSSFYYSVGDGAKQIKVKSRFKRPPAPSVDLDNSKLTYSLPSAQYVRIMLLDSLGQVVEKVEDGFKTAGQHEIQLKSSNPSRAQFNFNFTTDSSSYIMMMGKGHIQKYTGDLSSEKNRRTLINRIFKQWTESKREPVESRVNMTLLDSLLEKALKEKDIYTAYTYGIVVGAGKDSVIMAGNSELGNKLKTSEFKSRLFPNDLVVEANDLALFFPQQSMYLFKQISISVFISFIFISVIVVCFVFTIRTIFKQKEFSNRLTNFINNMTHEFKTPISTISLASEAISKPENIKNKERVLRYGGIIYDENLRMRNQVDKILQMAVLEEGDFELNKTQVDIHKLIDEAAQKMSIQVEAKKGKIISQLRAKAHIIEADALHLANIIHNLIDNAIKYTKKKPSITISTENNNGSFQFSVKDNGVGLNPEEQKHIFDKYYRVPTGNVHDVKGFGLGLSYVKLMVEAHGGSIHLNSEPEKGSTFEVSLPVTTES
ncbi:HAMP domain-containing histidine kinase [candidate division KSB1 bacterium]|nr:HAMP domain-containing histidine kinase [candidate division KSB1 bacterium]